MESGRPREPPLLLGDARPERAALPRGGSVLPAAAGLERLGGWSGKEIGTATGIPPAAWSRARGGDPRLAGASLGR